MNDKCPNGLWKVKDTPPLEKFSFTPYQENYTTNSITKESDVGSSELLECHIRGDIYLASFISLLFLSHDGWTLSLGSLIYFWAVPLITHKIINFPG